MKPHKWAKEIKACAEGIATQWRCNIESGWTDWKDVIVDAGAFPPFYQATTHEYRIKPEPKPDYQYDFTCAHVALDGVWMAMSMRAVWDGETLKPKSVEIVK